MAGIGRVLRFGCDLPRGRLMSLRFLVLWAGRRQRDRWEELSSDYRNRIVHWHPVEDRPLRVRDRGPSRRADEAQAMLDSMPEPCWPVALDLGGKMLSSEQLAGQVETWRQEWPHPVVFLVGSDLGLDPELLRRCRTRWSLGPLTLPHQLARLVLYEQLYRSLAIGSGIQYHRPP